MVALAGAPADGARELSTTQSRCERETWAVVVAAAAAQARENVEHALVVESACPEGAGARSGHEGLLHRYPADSQRWRCHIELTRHLP